MLCINHSGNIICVKNMESDKTFLFLSTAADCSSNPILLEGEYIDVTEHRDLRLCLDTGRSPFRQARGVLLQTTG